jgi:outer membrane protein, heavy metal efflux system
MHAKRSVVLLMIWILSGCAARRYRSAPIVPTESASRLESRNLGDPSLQSFVEENVGHPVAPWPPKTWDLGTLSLAALYFNPALEGARARVTEAQAAILTAGARPNPSLSVAPGIPSPYLFNLNFAVPIETAGKRDHRIQSARSLEHASRFEFADSALIPNLRH